MNSPSNWISVKSIFVLLSTLCVSSLAYSEEIKISATDPKTCPGGTIGDSVNWDRIANFPETLGLEVDGQLCLTGRLRKGADGKYHDQMDTMESEIELTKEISDRVEFFMEAKLSQQLRENGKSEVSPLLLGQFIKSVGITIKDAGVKGLEVTLGKHEMQYGQNVEAMPVYDDNILNEQNHFNELFGMSVVMKPEELKGLMFGASLFETHGDDLKIGKINGYSLKVEKALSDRLSMEVSAMHKGNGYLDEGERVLPANYFSVGANYLSKDGRYQAYGEIIKMKGDESYFPEKGQSGVGAVVGAVRNFPLGSVSVEAGVIEKIMTQGAVGGTLNLTNRLTAGAELRYTDRRDGEPGGLSGAIRLSCKVGKVPEDRKSLFGKKK